MFGRQSDDANGLGLPHRSRSDAVSTLIGFHSAIGCNQPGRVSVGTNTFDTKVIGKSTVNATWLATSTEGTIIPIQTPTSDIANAKRSNSPTPARNSGTLCAPATRQPGQRASTRSECPRLNDVRHHPTGEHRRARHGQRAKAVDDAFADVIVMPIAVVAAANARV